MRLVTAGLIGLLAATPLQAQEPVQQEREHTVRVGDTLWDLAGFYFSNPFQWRVIYEANPVVVEDPHWIYPEEVLVIPGIAPDVQPRTDLVVPTRDRPLRTVFYRPPPVTRETEPDPTVLAEPTLTRTPVRVGEFNSAPILLDPDRLTVLGGFMRAIRDDYAGRGAPTSAHPRDLVFLSYESRERPQVGDRLALVAVGRRVDGARRDHRIIDPRAVVRITQLTRDVMEAEIETQYGPVFPDQLVVPLAMFPDFQVEEAEPVEGGFDLEGEILEFVEEGQPMYGPTALGFIDVGSRDGVSVGDVFEAYLPERASRERRVAEFMSRPERLPPERVALMRVMRVSDQYATVKVEDVRLLSLEEGLPVRRVRRIP